MKKHLLIPFAIFLFIFGVDKLFYIPGVRALFVKNNYNFYDMIFRFEDTYYDYHLEKWKKKGLSEKEIFENSLVFLGTSRSETFREYTDRDILNNPYVKNKEQVLQKPVIAHFMRAGTVFHTYQLFQHVIEKYPRDVVFALEINYGGLNANSYIRQKKDAENLKWSSFREIYPFLSNRELLSFFSSRFFVLNLYSVSLSKPFQKTKDQTPEEMINNLFVIVQHYVNNKTDNLTGFIYEGIQEGTENEEQIINYKKFIDNFMNTLYYNFRVSNTDDLLMRKIIEDAKNKNLNIIFYRPKIHKDLRKATDEKHGIAEEKYIEDMRELISGNGFLFIDLEKDGEILCNYFRDPSHLSKTCIPEIIEKFDNLVQSSSGNRGLKK